MFVFFHFFPAISSRMSFPSACFSHSVYILVFCRWIFSSFLSSQIFLLDFSLPSSFSIFLNRVLFIIFSLLSLYSFHSSAHLPPRIQCAPLHQSLRTQCTSLQNSWSTLPLPSTPNPASPASPSAANGTNSLHPTSGTPSRSPSSPGPDSSPSLTPSPPPHLHLLRDHRATNINNSSAAWSRNTGDTFESWRWILHGCFGVP